MGYQMSEMDLLMQERQNTGTTWTRIEQFEKDGYFVVRDIWNPEELYHPVPRQRGIMNWWGKSIDQYTYNDVETQVEGSLARYNHPQYRRIHSTLRKKIEKIIDRKLYNTYYYDRFYFEGQDLPKHADRNACEISVTIHISTNLPDDYQNWAFKVKTPDTYTDKRKTTVLVPGDEREVILSPGDGIIYKGSERPHWRDPLEVPKKKWYQKGQKEYYYHQIFFHYVLADGERAHCAWDKSP